LNSPGADDLSAPDKGEARPNVQVFSVTARYRRDGLTKFDLRYENQADRFTLSPVCDTDSFRVMPGVELRRRALLNGSAWVGYRRFEPKVAALPC